MRITSKPVDVDALRQDWLRIVDNEADEKTRRVARRCCWENIAADLLRYGRVDRIRLLTLLFESSAFASQLEYRIEYDGPQAAASWLEEQLGVKLEGESDGEADQE